MKFLVTLLMFSGLNCYAVTDKNPEVTDISIKNLVERNCILSGYFNPMACEKDILNCYYNYRWPKTVSVGLKIDVVTTCTYKIIRR